MPKLVSWFRERLQPHHDHSDAIDALQSAERGLAETQALTPIIDEEVEALSAELAKNGWGRRMRHAYALREETP